jgi:hypothetical protein
MKKINNGKSFLKNSKLLELPGCGKCTDLKFQGMRGWLGY